MASASPGKGRLSSLTPSEAPEGAEAAHLTPECETALPQDLLHRGRGCCRRRRHQHGRAGWDRTQRRSRAIGQSMYEPTTARLYRLSRTCANRCPRTRPSPGVAEGPLLITESSLLRLEACGRPRATGRSTLCQPSCAQDRKVIAGISHPGGGGALPSDGVLTLVRRSRWLSPRDSQ